MIVVLVIIAYVIIGYFEISRLNNDNQKKELVLYSITFFLAFIISILISLDIKIPSTVMLTEKIITSILGGG